jgi:hypothetical protein
VISVLLVASVLAISFLAHVPSAYRVCADPREDDLTISYYSTIEAAYTALVAGEVDLIGRMGYSPSLFPTGHLDSGGFITGNQYDNAVSNPNLVVAPVRAFNMYQLDLNNNYTIPDYPGIQSPMSYFQMRQAIAYLTDKNYIVSVICGGFAERIDEPLPARLSAWGNPGSWYPNYVYEYDPNAAKTLLDTTFAEGTTFNPYYDPAFPSSAQYIRTYPAGNVLAGQDLDPLVVCVRIDDSHRLQAGRLVYGNMRKLGIPVNAIEGTSISLHDRVMGQHNYHLYTGASTTWKYPTHIYGLYHSSFTYPYGPNYITGVNSLGTPNYPLLDFALSVQFFQAPTFAASVTGCSAAMSLFTTNCISIPLWSDASYNAYSNRLLGVVNMDGYGLFNSFTFMNAYKVDGSPIRIGLAHEPSQMNIIYTPYCYDYLTLDPITLYNCLETPPYNLAKDQGNFIRDWEKAAWVDRWGGIKTKMVQAYRSDSSFVEPETGYQSPAMGATVNSSDVFFSAWYLFHTAYSSGGPCWLWPSYEYLDHINIVNDSAAEFCFNTASYWDMYAATGPVLPMDTWMTQPELVASNVEVFVDPVTPGTIDLTERPVWFDYVEADGSPLTFGTDYNIVEGKLYIYPSLVASTLTVSYWYVNDPRGFTPGGIAWQTIFEGGGMYYCTGFTAGVGGRMSLNGNPFYFMETPYLGDIDFERTPSYLIPLLHGGYMVNIFDLALASGAFGSQGTGVPSSNWFAGADLAPNGGVIDIYDEVTVTGIHWNEEYDIPE